MSQRKLDGVLGVQFRATMCGYGHVYAVPIDQCLTHITACPYCAADEDIRARARLSGAVIREAKLERRIRSLKGAATKLRRQLDDEHRLRNRAELDFRTLSESVHDLEDALRGQPQPTPVQPKYLREPTGYEGRRVEITGGKECVGCKGIITMDEHNIDDSILVKTDEFHAVDDQYRSPCLPMLRDSVWVRASHVRFLDDGGDK